jgi:hypothetical protein
MAKKAVKKIVNEQYKLEYKFIKEFIDRKNFVGSDRKVSIALNKLYKYLVFNKKMSPDQAASRIGLITINI